MALRFGVVVVPEHPAGDDMVARMAKAIEQARLCAELGFDTRSTGQALGAGAIFPVTIAGRSGIPVTALDVVLNAGGVQDLV